MIGDRFPELPELQRLFWQLITAPEGVASGVDALRREGRLAETDLSFLVDGDARLDPVGRLDVYADMYFYRLRDCLAEDFPKLLAWLGDARFHNLVTDFVLAHPPTHFSLRELGRPLPGFVEGHALAGERPGLADLAALEWARCDVFDDVDTAPLTRDALLRAAAEPEALRLRRLPASRWLELDPIALRRWRELDDDAAPETADTPAPPADARASTPVLVWRRDLSVLHRSLADDESACLRALDAEGATLAEVAEVLVEAQPPGTADEDVAARFAGLLERWAADAILIRA